MSAIRSPCRSRSATACPSSARLSRYAARATMRLEQRPTSPAAERARECHAPHRGPRVARGGRHRRLRRAADARRLRSSWRSPSTSATGGCTSGTCSCRSTRPPSPAARSSGECFTDPAAANTAIQNEATRFGGGAGSSYNGQVGGTNQGTITLLYQSKTYAAGSVPARRHRDAPPCDTPSLMFDVKASEAGLPLIFKIPGLSEVDRDQRARTRAAEAGRDPGGDAPRRRSRPALHLRLRDLRQRGDRRRARNGAADQGRHERRRPALEHDDADPRLDPLGARRCPDPPRRRHAIRTPPAARSSRSATTPTPPTGSSTSAATSTGAAPAARNVWLLPGSCAPDAYFATADCSAGVQAEVDLGAPYPLTGADVTADVWASVDGAGHYPLTPGSTSGLVDVDRDRRASARRERSARGRAGLELGADLGHLERQDLQDERQPLQGRWNVRSRSARVRRRRPLRPDPQRPGVRERRHLRPGATPSRPGRRPRSGSASPSPAASRCSRWQPTPWSSSASPAARTSRSTVTRRSRTSPTRSSRAAGLPTSSTRASRARRTTPSGRSPSPGSASRRRPAARSARSSTG